MLAPISIAFGLALVIAAVAAFFDSRSGTIPNWLTMPPIALAPLAYASAFGFEHGLSCLAAVLLSGVPPYLLFRRAAIGGGDVKLFAALAAVTGFDPLIGVQIQLGAFALAMVVAFFGLAWRGRLLATLASAAATVFNKVLPKPHRLRVYADLATPVRMGGAVFASTLSCGLPRFLSAWSVP